MTIGKTPFDTNFIFDDDPNKRLALDTISAAGGIVQLLMILTVLITALGLSLLVLFENGSAPPDVERSMDDMRSFQGGISPPCFVNPGLSEPGFNETLRGRQPIAGDLPNLRFEDFCHVPVF